MSLNGWRGPLLAGTVLRVAAWAAGRWSGGWIQQDTPQYWDLASNGLAGYGATGGNLFAWSLMRPPGYPVILATLRSVGDSHAAVALLQVGFGIAALALTWTLTRRLAGDGVAALATWWLALSPIHIVDTSVLLTEVPFSVFLLSAVLLLAPLVDRDTLEPWRWTGSGVVLGLATLIRPIVLYLPIVVLAAMALSRLRKHMVVSGLLFLVAFAVPVGGWMARNHHVTGVATVSTIQGINLAFYRAAGAIAYEEGISIRRAQERMTSLVNAESDPSMNPAELARVDMRVGVREILQHPQGYAYMFVRGLAYTLVGPARSHFVERFRGSPVEWLTTPAVVASAISAMLMAIVGAVGAFAWIRAREWRRLLLVALPLAYMLLIGSGYEAWARFRVPLEPLLVILGAVGIRYIWGWVRGTNETVRAQVAGKEARRCSVYLSMFRALAIPIRKGIGPEPGIKDARRL